MAKDEKIKAVILAAGYATRLYPLTINIPKPLLMVKKDKAVIDFLVDNLDAARHVEEIVVVTNHKFYGDFSAWAKKRKSRRRLTVVNDGTFSNDDRLGAIGDIDFAMKKRKISGDVIVVGGDNLFDRSFGGFLRFAVRHRPFSSLGLFRVAHREEVRRYGIATLSKTDRLRRFEEKPSHPRSTLAATCLYYFPKETHRLLRKYVADRRTSNDKSGSYIQWLLNKNKVYGYIFKKGHWHDIGHLDSYKEVVAQFVR